jgi:hypothetical protein
MGMGRVRIKTPERAQNPPENTTTCRDSVTRSGTVFVVNYILFLKLPPQS